MKIIIKKLYLYFRGTLAGDAMVLKILSFYKQALTSMLFVSINRQPKRTPRGRLANVVKLDTVKYKSLSLRPECKLIKIFLISILSLEQVRGKEGLKKDLYHKNKLVKNKINRVKSKLEETFRDVMNPRFTLKSFLQVRFWQLTYLHRVIHSYI